MNRHRAPIVLTAALLAAPAARSGHEQSVYPSFYPHEIEVSTVAPAAAGESLQSGKLHAYIGEAAAPPAANAGAVDSLGAVAVVTLNPLSALAKDETSACSTLAAVARRLAAAGGGFVFHPYPVTPFHGDYIHHADRADHAKEALAALPSHSGPIAVRAGSAGLKDLLPQNWIAGDGAWDVAIEEIGIRNLIAESTYALNGWMGPRWTRSGWFHAYRMLAPSVTDPGRRERIRSQAERLEAGQYADAVERINLERDLVAELTAGCRALAAGYTVRRQYFNNGFASGVENIGFDSLEGLHSPMFLRTVKLKDFPWNGWLHLGLEGEAGAAWNPIGGFSDDFGRLMWFAVGDPALIPSPYEPAWMPNRISEVSQTPGR